MTEQAFPKLSRSPLSEALIDIRLKEDLPPASISNFQAPADFPLIKPLRQGHFQVKVTPDSPIQAEIIDEGILGTRFERADASEVVQFRRNGLTYSILRNYPGYDVLSGLTKEAWKNYLAVAGDAMVSRLAVRYVNSIVIPLGADYDEYLTKAPRVPESVPQIVHGFLQRVVVPFNNSQTTAIITQALEGPGPAVLDIDVYIEGIWEVTSDSIWTELEKLRAIADRIFFSSLTDKVLGSYR